MKYREQVSNPRRVNLRNTLREEQDGAKSTNPWLNKVYLLEFHHREWEKHPQSN